MGKRAWIADDGKTFETKKAMENHETASDDPVTLASAEQKDFEVAQLNGDGELADAILRMAARIKGLRPKKSRGKKKAD